MKNRAAQGPHAIEQKQMEEVRLAVLGARENRKKLAILIQTRARSRLQGRAAAVRDRTGGLELASRADGAVLEGASKIAARGVGELIPAAGARTASLGQGADGVTLAVSGAGLGLVGLGTGIALLGLREGLREQNKVDLEVDRLMAQIDRAMAAAEARGGRDLVIKIMKDPRVAQRAAEGVAASYEKTGVSAGQLEDWAEAGILREARAREADRHGAEYRRGRNRSRPDAGTTRKNDSPGARGR